MPPFKLFGPGDPVLITVHIQVDTISEADAIADGIMKLYPGRHVKTGVGYVSQEELDDVFWSPEDEQGEMEDNL
jgi:hypothetical protein